MEPVVPGFSWEEDASRLCRHVVKEKNGEQVDEWVPILPFNVVPVRALREGPNIVVIEVDVVYANGRVEHVAIPDEVIYASRPAQVLARETGIAISHREATDLAAFLEMIVSERASDLPETQVITTAEWRDDELVVPGRNLVSPRKAFTELRKYGERKGAEPLAREAWREILQYAALPGNERLLLILGMPLGSLYAARLRHPPYRLTTGTFALHLTGDSAQGKTQAAIAAMMTLGDATEKSTRANLYRTWNMSAQAPAALAHQLGILPLYFDEAATSQKSPEEFTQTIFDLAQGTERQRATVTGDVDEVERWECCILSTGEMRLSAKSGLVGVRRRVQELYAPFAPQDHSDQVFRRASDFHGWPLHWITSDPHIEDAAKLFDEIEHTFEDQISWLNAAALNLSVCGLGALMLARALDSDYVTVATVQRAVERVVKKLGKAALEEGLNIGHKLAIAVWEDVARHEPSYPAVDVVLSIVRERDGVILKDGSVGIFKSALERIALDAGIPDFNAGVRILLDENLMVQGPSGQQQVRVGFKKNDGTNDRKRFYVFKPLTAADA